MIALRPVHEVDERCSVEDFGTLGLCDATADCYDHSAAGPFPRDLHLADLTEFRVHLLCSLIANVASIIDNNIGVIRLHRRKKPERLQEFYHPCGVIGVHLAAVCLDEHTLNHVLYISAYRGFLHIIRLPLSMPRSGVSRRWDSGAPA